MKAKLNIFCLTVIFFKNRNNILTIIYVILIANNGTAYYPFFTCFLLCVTGVYKLLRNKNIKDVLPSLKIIALITMFFIPLNSHGVSFLDYLISMYNEYMPLVNENRMSYLGIFAGIGFLYSVIYLFFPDVNERCLDNMEFQKNKLKIYMPFFSRLVIFSILLSTIGGFSSIICALILPVIRSYNRISIFIMFISICSLCLYLHNFFERVVSWEILWKKLSVYILGMVFVFVCIAEQLPTFGALKDAFAGSKLIYDEDEEFVAYIEEQLGDSDMVYQLPYHGFPEMGVVNNMLDYSHFRGYLHSKNLKWSYGSIKGSDADKWNVETAALDMPDMIERIKQKGFHGIYIDSWAYTQEELISLMSDIEQVIQEKPYVSKYGNLLFYNLND